MIGLRRALAAGGAAFALAGSAYAADQLVGRDRPPAAATVTIDSTAPLFQAEGLVGGQVLDRCTVLTNQGPQPADVTLFGSASEADLSPWLDLELIRGTLPPGSAPGDCTGFTPDAVDYGAGTDGVVFRGTLDTLPSAEDGIADPTRWAVGEQHAYLLRIHYTGGDPQQGLSTVQAFNWGATPFDDRPADPFVEPATDPGTGTPGGAAAGSGAPSAAPTSPPATIRLERQCKVITFPTKAYIGARAISRVTKVMPGRSAETKKAAEKAQLEGSGGVQQPLSSSTASVVAPGEQVAPAELQRRKDLLATTRRRATGSTARRAPVLVVRLSPSKDDETISVRVGLRKNAKMTSPKRWRWVRFRLNSGPTKSTLKWPFTAKAKMGQLKLGYNQIDLTLNRGQADQRLEGLPRLMRRSFAFIVGEPSSTNGTATAADCTLG